MQNCVVAVEPNSHAAQAGFGGGSMWRCSSREQRAAPLVHSLIVSAKLTDGMRPVRLKLDSGTNVPFLYNTSDDMALGLYNGVALRGGGANGSQQTFSALPSQQLKIGSVDIGKVPFIT